MPRGVTNVLQIVVLAASAQTTLHRGSAYIVAFLGAKKHILELHHARVGEQQRWIVARHQTRRAHNGVTLRLEEAQKFFSYVGCFHGAYRLCGYRREAHRKARDYTRQVRPTQGTALLKIRPDQV